MGHFYKSAHASYSFGRPIAALGAESVELGQTIILSSSSYAQEDKPSNWQGRNFGKLAYSYDKDTLRGARKRERSGAGRMSKTTTIYSEVQPDLLFDIPENWNSFLKNSGAVKWGTINGKSVETLLIEDAKRYQNLGYFAQRSWTVGGSLDYLKSQPIWQCLCDGDTPKENLGY